MQSSITTTETAIASGIKAVAIGKRGSGPLGPDLIVRILDELKSGIVPATAQGAFFGALVIKGVTAQEKRLGEAFALGVFTDPYRLVGALAGDAPEFVQRFCARLLNRETLELAEARRLGDFLFSELPGDGARGMIASILRVRYETPDEYEGLLLSMQNTIEEPFRRSVPPGDPVVQIAEPFDGVDHSNIITPLISDFIQRLGYRVVSLVGRNSGPKSGHNLLDLAVSIQGRFLNEAGMMGDTRPSFGWFLRQQDLSHAIDHWVELRRQIIKRPFLSTLERLINPFKAQVMIASAFHPPYGEKMRTICERAGYPGIIIVRNGIEGTLAFPLMRAVKILCAARGPNGHYERTEFTLDPQEYMDAPIRVEERLPSLILEKNRELIETYQEAKKTSYALFDMRVRFTCAGLKKAIEWINEARIAL